MLAEEKQLRNELKSGVMVAITYADYSQKDPKTKSFTIADFSLKHRINIR